MSSPAGPVHVAPEPPSGPWEKIRRLVVGRPRELGDPRMFHRLALVSFLAWVGLGADGLSSACYGPEEAYKALGEHTYLAVALAAATAITVFVISWSYVRIIEAFPSGGGGYVVPFKLLGPTAGALSGSALIIDYVLTIAISVASGVDALFSYVPDLGIGPVKPVVAAVVVGALLVLNLRGVKESVTVLAPVFLLFVLTHAIVIGAGILGAAPRLPEVVRESAEQLDRGLATLGAGGLVLVFLRAYSLGGGTYTGIEAVANGMNIMREPVVRTAKRTMLYMSVSLALTASGILVCYLLQGVRHEEGRTMNAVLIREVSSGWTLGSVRFGRLFEFVTLGAEAALLFVAAQAGFLAGPRVMASMAVDSWLPHRFAALSERLTMRNGIWIMAAAALVVVWATDATVSTLVVLYSINVFLTFSLSNVAMCVRALKRRQEHAGWKRDLATHVVASALCVAILGVTLFEKWALGGWKTLVVTGLLLLVCLSIRRHYAQVKQRLRRLESALADLPDTGQAAPAIEPQKPTAVLLVESYGGVGIHTLLSIFRFFPDYFRNVVFVSVAVIDSGNFKGQEELEALKAATQRTLTRYVDLASKLGLAALGEMRLGTDVLHEAEQACEDVARRFPRHMFFGGKLVFEKEAWYERLLHNETAFAIQRRLAWKGHPMTILPVRMLG